jgi:2'-hydroxyisoflavone reductase
MPLSRRRFVFSSTTAGLVLGCSRRGEGTTAPTQTAAKAVAPAKVEPAVPSGPSLLVLGGTKFLGPHLVEAALAAGFTVTLFNRGKTRPDLFPDVEKLRGDRDGKLDALAGRKWTAVVDTSGYVPRIVTDSAELLAGNVEQYVFISSISAYASLAQPGVDEGAPVATMDDPTNEEVMKNYGALKALCEQAAEKAMPGRTTNVRPGLIVGPDDPTDRFTYWPARLLRGGEVLAPGAPQDPTQFVDVRDLAKWIVGAIVAKHMGIYNLVAAPIEMGKVLDACKAAAGTEATFTWVPSSFLADQKVAPWSDMPAWVPLDDPESAGFAQVSNARALATGLETTPIDKTVADTLAWWKKEPDEHKAKLRAGLTPEREAEVLAAWHASRKAGKGKRPPKQKKAA